MNSNLSYTHDNSETESFDISSRNTPYSTSSFAIGIISIFFILTIMKYLNQKNRIVEKQTLLFNHPEFLRSWK